MVCNLNLLLECYCKNQKDLAGIYLRCGLKNLGTVFLLTDALIPDEKFLVLINDLLASGEIPDLFHDDEIENIVSSVRNEVSPALLRDYVL
jgi:dynein heavy chain